MGYHMTFWYMYTLHCSKQGKRTYFLCGMCVHTHGWRSKNNVQELALPQTTGLALRGLSPAHWPSSMFALLKVFKDFPQVL